MARSATGLSVIDVARTQLRDAKTIEELRCAQAVIFPLECGLSREDTANARGLSTGWAGQLRRSFLKEQAHPQPGQLKRPHPGSGSGRAYLSRQAEQELLRPFVEKARQAGILMVSERRQALEKKLGRTTATATTDNVLHRHGWRTLSPDKNHPNGEVPAQDEGKKNFLTSYGKSIHAGTDKGKARSA